MQFREHVTARSNSISANWAAGSLPQLSAATLPSPDNDKRSPHCQFITPAIHLYVQHYQHDALCHVGLQQLRLNIMRKHGAIHQSMGPIYKISYDTLTIILR